MIDNSIKEFAAKKNRLLVLAIMIDAIGMLSYIIPIFEAADVVWAPISAFLIYVFFGKQKIVSITGFFEEIVPFTDLIPTACIAWYIHYGKNEVKTFNEFVSIKLEKENKLREIKQQN